ncbi:MAG: YcfL family protein [Kiritimatiellae bacterium]|nr:YcfL family protein [Kiritimatiellia bacterium]MDD4342085.1 YcfL family protein [Kiritimatiellia bacterium]
MKTMAMILAAALAVVLAAGCAAPNTAGFTVGAETDMDGNLQEVLQVDNAKVARQLAVEDLIVGQTKNGLMKANVKVMSRLNKTTTAQSKFAWFDEDGAEIDPDGDAWRPLVLHGKETKSIHGVAPNARAVSFKLRIRTGERTRWIID